MLASFTSLTALVETIGVASIFPFMTAVTGNTGTNIYRRAFDIFGLVPQTPATVVYLAGAITCLALLAANILSATNTFMQQKFVCQVRQRVSSDLFAGYLQMPYAFHTRRDSASLMRTMINDVDDGLTALVSAFLMVYSKIVIAVLMLAAIIWTNRIVGVASVLVLGTAYWIIFSIAKGKQAKLGRELSSNQANRMRTALDGFGAVKELKVSGRELSPVHSFANHTRRLLHADLTYAITSSLPRHAIEVVVFCGVVLVATILAVNDPTAPVIPTIALYAFAAYKLLPALQQLYQALIAVKFRQPAAKNVHADLDLVIKNRSTVSPPPHKVAASDIPVPHIELRNVCFSYPGANRQALRDVSICIPQRSSFAFIGRTGSGKTTAIDLILGLFTPSSGAILVNGQELGNMEPMHRRCVVGYVPQSVFIAQMTVAQNIAFGFSSQEVSMEKVKSVARLAQASDFISELPAGFDTILGERGVSLSGGQRQRLGIARALYTDPQLLILDEATSAVDALTEVALMNALDRIAIDRTVIVIAHRLGTVKHCHQIALLDNGIVESTGTFSELSERSDLFRAMLDGAGMSGSGSVSRRALHS